MRKLIYSLVVTTALLGGTILTGCQTPTQKVDNAKVTVQDAKQDLKDAQKDANAELQKIATAEEWKIFKSESEVKIKDNEIRIAELKVKIAKPGQIFDDIYANKINTLEQKNSDLRIKMDAYEKSQSDWEKFKQEFNHDMDELGQALKDLTVDNKK